MVTTEIELTFLIADLSGYTALTEAHGNVHAAHAVTRYAEITHTVLQPGARFVERVGDEVVIAAEDAASAVRTAVALRQAVEQEPLFPTLRCGIHAGCIVEHGGRYFGSALNLAARVATHAQAGQILCTERAMVLAAGLGDIAYQPLGLVRFKNIVDLIAVYEVVVGRQSRESTVIDPVCRMQVRQAAAPAQRSFGGATYHFCSRECARAFAQQPEHYVGIAGSG